MQQNNNHQAPTTVEQGFLMFVAENSMLRPDDLEKLFYNGFDNPESFQLITPEELQALGTLEEPTVLYDKIMATMEVYREYVAANGNYVSSQRDNNTNAAVIDEVNEEGRDTVNRSYTAQVPPARVPKSAKPITIQLMLGKVASKPKIHHMPHLKEKTHLQMASKNLSHVAIPNPQTEYQKQQSNGAAEQMILVANCPNLQFIYLENNFLTQMTGAF